MLHACGAIEKLQITTDSHQTQHQQHTAAVPLNVARSKSEFTNKTQPGSIMSRSANADDRPRTTMRDGHCVDESTQPNELVACTHFDNMLT